MFESLLLDGGRVAPFITPNVERTYRGHSNFQIQPWFPEGSEELNLGAAIHNNLQACIFRKARGIVVVNSDLAPEHLSPNGDCSFCKAIELFFGPEYVHHVDGLVNFF
jgi:hypothetical protein